VVAAFLPSKLPPLHYFIMATMAVKEVVAETSCNYVWLDIRSLPIEEMNVGDVAIVLNVTTYAKEDNVVEVFDAGQDPNLIRALLQSDVQGKIPQKLRLNIFGFDEDGKVVTSDKEVDFSSSLTILKGKKTIDEIHGHLNRGLFSKPIHDIG
jgi:hypothetical protein